MITHYDLFAGIGGFSLALEEVFDEPIRHIFCEWESFPTAVLRRHWPDGEFWGDIAELVAHTERQRQQRQRKLERPLNNQEKTNGQTNRFNDNNNWCIVTGGFPCQPFSHAGRRKGTADDRYQWPNMYEVIRNTKPEWVIAENVRGLVTWNDGMVLEQVCADLEAEGYEVQPFIIPAVAVNAPHRRDRVWIIAHTKNNDGRGKLRNIPSQDATLPRPEKQHQDKARELSDANRDDTEACLGHKNAQDPISERVERWSESTKVQNKRPGWADWDRNWQEVAFATCNDSMDDGVQGRLVRLPDGTTITRPKHRKESLKAYGNAIVPQVAIEIMRAIKEANKEY